MDRPPTSTLLDRYQGGDAAAFGQLVERHQAALLRHATFLLGGRGEVEDVVQDAFLKLASRPPTLPDGLDPDGQHAALAAWLHKVTRNHCMDTIRSETRRRRREEVAAMPERTAGGQTVVEAEDTRAAVRRSLECLPDDQREVLFLRLLLDKSYREIAEVTGKKAGTVGWLISTGMKALGRELAPALGLVVDGTNDGPLAHGTRGGM